MKKLTDIQAEADLEARQQSIAQLKASFDAQLRSQTKPQLADAFTGELFTPRARNHYESNSGIPHAPAVDMPRPTVRQRVENLLNRGVDPLAHYVGTEGIDMDVPEEGDAPLTPSEQNYLDVIASDLAEQAPLPDEGLPRPSTEPAQPPSTSAASSGGVGAEPPREAAPAAGPTAQVPTR